MKVKHQAQINEMRGILAKFKDKTYNPFVDGERMIELLALVRAQREGRA